MFFIDKLILAAGALMGLGTLSSKLSSRFGVPVLVLFLGIGMAVGADGLGIEFDDHEIAHAVGTVALGAILFDGGLATSMGSFRLVWKPAGLLATVGVLITSLITGAAASWILDLPLLEGMLLGSIVGSTDAAAVFSVLRNAGLRVRERVAAMLEVESGSNDPMAIFLTVGLLEVLRGDTTLGPDLLVLFLQQMGVGAVVGIAAGRASVVGINRVHLGAAGLYPVFVGACGATTYGLAALLGGSGFLAVYLAGIVIGNDRIVFRRGTLLFFDGIAWGGQIAMFVVLGLLCTPSDVIPVAGQGLLVALVLIFVARPIIVVPIMALFRFTLRESLLTSWVGLKGAVPIILATFPLMFGLESGGTLFNVVFFVVLVSAIVQGTLTPWFARKLDLGLPSPPAPPVTLDVQSLFDVDADIVEYVIPPNAFVAGKHVRELGIPDGAVVAMIVRNKEFIPPRGSTVLAEGDFVFFLLRRDCRAALDGLFARTTEDEA
ncbi:MAG: potassium/proton antiporter [Myxococcales bacterium]|nr:potassium/proton antiporter [Myxococcales bacterium]